MGVRAEWHLLKDYHLNKTPSLGAVVQDLENALKQDVGPLPLS